MTQKSVWHLAATSFLRRIHITFEQVFTSGDSDISATSRELRILGHSDGKRGMSSNFLFLGTLLIGFGMSQFIVARLIVSSSKDASDRKDPSEQAILVLGLVAVAIVCVSGLRCHVDR